MNYAADQIGRNIFSVLAGILLGLSLFLLISWGVSIRLYRIEYVNAEPFPTNTKFTLSSLGFIIGSLAGGSLSAFISNRENKFIAPITGIILSGILLFLYFKKSYNIDFLKILICIAVIIAGIIGGLLVKKQE